MNSQLIPLKHVFLIKKHRERFSFTVFGRSGGSRTHGLLDPNQARYQLRYTPIQLNYYTEFKVVCQGDIP